MSEEISQLVAKLSDKDGLVRQNARLDLQTIGKPAVPQLCWTMNSKNKHARWEAARALAELVDPSSVPWLIKALDDKEFDIRWLAGLALIRIQLPALVPLLEALLVTRKQDWLWEGARHIIRGMARGDRDNILTPLINAFDSIDFRMNVPIEARKLLIALRDTPELFNDISGNKDYQEILWPGV
jgi:HEAT repeat protein